MSNPVSEALRLLRVYSDIKQGDLANSLHMQKSRVSELEKGKRIITVNTLKRYSQVFNITENDIANFAEIIKKDGEYFKKDVFNLIIRRVRKG